MVLSFSKLQCCSELLSGGLRPFQGCDVDLPHLKHCLHDTSGLLGILILQHLGQDLRNDLPRKTELVLQPAARPFFTALGELAPEVVNLRLCVAENLKRNRFIELEVRAAIERQKILS